VPRLTRWFIRAGLLYLLAALVLGVGLALDPAGLPAGLRPATFHLFVLGWITQLIFGVAHWMFPRASRDRPRGAEPLGWAAFALLNAGLLLRLVSEPAVAWPGGWLALSGGLQLAGALCWVLLIWPRVKER
jgi:hypothetical protein